MKTLFSDLGLSQNSLRILEKKGFEEPTPIQAETIPLLLNGEKNIIGKAQTGTGKTAAFGLPLIELINPKEKGPQALILAPTRELAVQVTEEIHSLMGDNKLEISTIYGGQSYSEQIRRLKKGLNIVVGTPGRVIDHLKKGTLKLDSVKYFVLDEADEMLNMGFIEDIEEILDHTSEDKSILLFSATMPPRILQVAQKYMPDYKLVEVKNSQLTADLTDQIYYEVRESDKFEALCRIMDLEEDFYGIIFCRTKIKTAELASKLADRGYSAQALHGDVDQNTREIILNDFRKKKLRALIATDVAARGIDVKGISHVINYSIPQNPEAYVHRIGRTGRAGEKGTAITFVTRSEMQKLIFIKRTAKTDIAKKEVPGIDEIIAFKSDKILNDILEVYKGKDFGSFKKLTEQLLKNTKNIEDFVDLLSSVLKYAFGDQLDRSSYNEINQSPGYDDPGTARLFFARGKRDGMTKQKLVKYIVENSEVRERSISGVDVFENFSFVSVPFKDSEYILKFIKNNKGKPLFEMASTKEKSGGRKPSSRKKRSNSDRTEGKKPSRRR